MNPIPPSLAAGPASVLLDRNSKSSGRAASRAAADGASPVLPEAADPQVDSSAPGLAAALGRIQGQNQASALTNLRDLDEALAATLLARQSLLSRPADARSVHAGVTPAAALRVLED